MSLFSERRVAVPVPVHQKPSLWKSLRQNIRHPLRRFTQENRDPPDDLMVRCDDHNLSYHHNARPRSPNRRRVKEVAKNRRQNKEDKTTADPEMSSPVPPYQAHRAPGYEPPYDREETAPHYGPPYGAQRFDSSGQAWRHEWDAGRYSQGMKIDPEQRPYGGYQDTRQDYRNPTSGYFEDPYYQQDLIGGYECTDELPRYSGNYKMQGRNAFLEKKKKQILNKRYHVSCVAPKINCSDAEDVFGGDSIISTYSVEDETEVSGSRTAAASVDQKQTEERSPASDGVLASTILQTYTDNTLDASALEVEAHNAILRLSSKVGTEIRHSAEEVGAVFTKATDVFLLGNHTGRSSRRKNKSNNDEGYGKYFEKFTRYDTAPDDHITDGTTEAEEETMGSTLDDSSSEEIEMAWPQWRQLTNGTLSFGKRKTR